MALTKLTAGIGLDLRESVTEGSRTTEDKMVVSASTNYTIGTGASSANKQWNDQRTLNTTNESLDLAGGVTNGFGTTVTFAKFKGIYLKNTASSGTLTVNTSLTNGMQTWLNGDLVLNPGAMLIYVDPSANGHAITAGTADLIKITTSANVTYDVAVWGE